MAPYLSTPARLQRSCTEEACPELRMLVGRRLHARLLHTNNAVEPRRLCLAGSHPPSSVTAPYIYDNITRTAKRYRRSKQAPRTRLLHADSIYYKSTATTPFDTDESLRRTNKGDRLNVLSTLFRIHLQKYELSTWYKGTIRINVIIYIYIDIRLAFSRKKDVLPFFVSTITIRGHAVCLSYRFYVFS